jgi:hypothetical protein
MPWEQGCWGDTSAASLLYPLLVQFLHSHPKVSHALGMSCIHPELTTGRVIQSFSPLQTFPTRVAGHMLIQLRPQGSSLSQLHWAPSALAIHCHHGLCALWGRRQQQKQGSKEMRTETVSAIQRQWLGQRPSKCRAVVWISCERIINRNYQCMSGKEESGISAVFGLIN